MKKKWIALILIIFAIIGIIIGCKKKESTKEEAYAEFQRKISSVKSYKCNAEIEVVGNKSTKEYVFTHTYNKPNNYKLEVLSPEHLKGKTIEYKEEKIIVTNPDINDTVELSNAGKNDQYMFIGDFMKNSIQSEDMNVELDNGYLVLETSIPGENKHFNKQVLYVNIDNKEPEKMEILDIEGKNRFTVSYKSFEYNK